MAKRFSDSDKWRKPWFRKLKPVYKLLWLYILDNCDHAGVWVVDMELASYTIGTTIKDAHALAALEAQIVSIADGSRWFIKDFPLFQYGETLNPSNRLHASVMKSLDRYGLWDEHNNKVLASPLEGPSKDLASPSLGVKDKDKDKDKDIEEKKEKMNSENSTKAKPHPIDCKCYFAELGMPETEAEKFLDHYEANGWRVGKNPMKDWKAAVRNWHKNVKARRFDSPVERKAMEMIQRTAPSGYPQEVTDLYNKPKPTPEEVAAVQAEWNAKYGHIQ